MPVKARSIPWRTGIAGVREAQEEGRGHFMGPLGRSLVGLFTIAGRLWLEVRF
jgi:hypothetical protein